MAATGRKRRRLTAAERRESILVAAVAAFAETGYERTRVADIAARVGVSEPVLFQNFGTKAALFLAALERAAGDFAGRLRELGETGADVQQAVTRIFSLEHMERLHRAGEVGVLFAEGAARHGAGGGPAIARVASALADLLEVGQRQGTIRTDVRAKTMAWWILSLVHGRGFRRQAAGPDEAGLENELYQLSLAMLLPAAAAGSPGAAG